MARQAGEGISLTAYDFNKEMLNEAERKYQDLKQKETISAIRFEQGDVNNLPYEKDYFDSVGITFGIRNLVYENSKAGQHLAEIHRVIRPGGDLVILESSKPANRVWRFINSLYLQLLLPYLGGVISGNLKAYRYLARSSNNYYSIREMDRILSEAGFAVRKEVPLFLGSVMLVIAAKK